MFQTIQLSSHISVQGEIAEVLSNGDVVIRDGIKVYRGRPIRAALRQPVEAAIYGLVTGCSTGLEPT